ncbi:MAG TPA: carbohydrate kinase family protein [Verrucomicrobiae bacterium]|jgi:sugar/nucleoside kinase (ribokinase family)|nr:carbohydrate kinase family protein [Verrucomicrobiae bacterium]
MNYPRHGILAAGHWIVDCVKRIDNWPEPSTLARIEQQHVANGGFAFNLLSDLAALDPSCPLFGAGLIGDDAHGRFIRERCRQLKIDDTMLGVTTEAPTSFTDVMTETGSGRRTFFYCPGANERLTEIHLQQLAAPAKIFCLGYLGFFPLLDGPMDADRLNPSARLLRRAQENGMITAADLVSAPNPDLRAQVLPTLPWLDILFLNEWEAGQLLKRELPKVFSAAIATEFAKDVRQLGVTGAVVLHSREGVVAVTGEGEFLAQGSVKLPESEIQGTVGAGDALAAGVLLARHHEMSWPEALKLGVCAATACLKSPTASDGMLPWQQCLELGNKYGFAEFSLRQ